MKKTTILLVMALLCLNICGKAQTKKSPNPSTEKNSSLSSGEGWGGALNLGQKIPATILNHNYPVIGPTTKQDDSLNLNQFKGKLILLDFWAAWCSTCINKFKILDSLQQQYKGQLQVVLVNSKNTGDIADRIKGILDGTKAPFVKTSLISIYNDTKLAQLFPQSYLPHYAWLGAKGELLALTGAGLLNEQSIQYFLADIKKHDLKALAELKQQP